MVRLVTPSQKYKKGYMAGLRELMKKSAHPEILKRETENFPAYLEEVKNAAKGVTKGVSRSEYWLVDGDTYIGMIQIRHRPSGRYQNLKSNIYYDVRPSKRRKGYGTKILELGLKRARKLGLKKIIATCDENNVASRKIIEKNGGVLKEKVKTPEGVVLKYFIRVR